MATNLALDNFLPAIVDDDEVLKFFMGIHKCTLWA